jgi:GMP synthase (glutamine-hydrolysing)
MSDHSRIVILDFGSQYTQVIARRIRECQVYSQIVPYHTPAREIAKLNPRGLILSGGPASVYGKKAPHPEAAIFRLGVPVLGICYGVQLMAHLLGGKVEHSAQREYGPAKLHVQAGGSALFAGLGREIAIWNSHGDKVTRLPRGFRAVGTTDNAPYAAIEHPAKRFFGLQFHPEVVHTPRGREILENFVHRICGCGQDWTMGGFIEETCARLRAQIGGDHVILGLSGGVDSSVAAALLHRAIGDQLTCVFVDNGLLRANEAAAVQRLFGEHFHMRLKTVDASAQFLRRLRGVTSPERKRKIIGREFIRVFDATVARLSRGKTSKYRWLGQGTLYPDVIESVAIDGNPAALIKSHHNVGGLPKRMKLKLVEPLRELFKDEVREVGAQLGLPREVTGRQPFPGPGLAVRILGEITRERLRILREADSIVVAEMKAADWYYQVWQSFAVLLPVRSVGVMGDERTYAQTIALRIVGSQDGMTADWTRLPYDLLARISTRIINEVKGVNRVCYDISSKPPATIEWE